METRPYQYMYIVRETSGRETYFHKTVDAALRRSRSLARRNIAHTLMDESGNFYETGASHLMLKF